MAYPLSLSTDSSPFHQMGPYTVGSDLYVFTEKIGIDGFVIDCWKSIDSGETWAIQDEINSPDVSFSNTCFDNDHTIFMFSVVPNGTPDPDSWVSIRAFDCDNDTWGEEVVTDITQHTTFGPTGAYRNDGVLVILVQNEHPDSNHYCEYFEYEIASETWGSLISCGEDDPDLPWYPAMVLGCADRVHLVMTSGTSVPGDTVTLYQQPLSNAGSLGAIQTIASYEQLTGDAYYFAIQINAQTYDDQIVIGWTPDTTADQDNRILIQCFIGESANDIDFVESNIETLDTILSNAVVVGSQGFFVAWVETQYPTPITYTLKCSINFDPEITIGSDPNIRLTFACETNSWLIVLGNEDTSDYSSYVWL